MSTVVGCTQGECGNRVKRIYKSDNAFWEEGNLEREIFAKQLALDIDALLDAIADESGPQFKCQIVGCNRWFKSTLAYEGHYNTCHRYSCNTCGRMFPIARLLELHVLETHDTLFALLAKKQNMYECLVGGCDSKFASDKDREKHLIDFHSYPRDFAFHYRRRKRYIRRKKGKGKKKSNNKQEEEQRTVEMIDSTADLLSGMEMDRSSSTKTSSTSAADQGAPPANPFTAQLVGESGRVYSCKVPDSFSFGRRGRGRGGYQPTDRGGRGRGGGRGGRGRGRGRGGGAHRTADDNRELTTPESDSSVAPPNTRPRE